MEQGDPLPTVQRLITQDGIERYAEASGDFNPIHVDREFAATSQFGGTIAHGMSIAATLSEMMTEAFSVRWHETGRLKLRFRGPVYPGDTVTAFGEVKRVRQRDGGREIVCSVGVRKQDGDAAITGDATVTVQDEE
jgi:3-hydroxybutyryl-CoA dehydratase